jgi:hypothetical protein
MAPVTDGTGNIRWLLGSAIFTYVICPEFCHIAIAVGSGPVSGLTRNVSRIEHCPSGHPAQRNNLKEVVPRIGREPVCNSGFQLITSSMGSI